MPIGKKLKARRKELKLRVEDVARKVGMAASTLYDLERGEQRSTTKLAALCYFYGLNWKWVEKNEGPRLISGSGLWSEKTTALQARYTVHGMLVSPEEVEFGIEWGKLEEPARSFIRQHVMLLVAEQVRSKRREKKGDHPGDTPPNHAEG